MAFMTGERSCRHHLWWLCPFRAVTRISLCAVVFVFVGAAHAQTADTIITNARIYTVNSHQPWAEAVAISAERIMAVGSTKGIEKYRGPSTRIVDASNHLALPGFTDCHAHFLSGALSLLRVQLDDAKTITEYQQRIKAYAQAHPDAQWIVGRGWTYPAFGDTALPDKRYLDEIVPDRPVAMEGFDGHTWWANTKALSIAGITKDTQDPPNGHIVRDEKTGEPTGALKEAAAGLLERAIPQPSREQKLDALRAGLREAAKDGVVRIHSAGGDFEVLDLLDQLRRENQLTARFYVSNVLEPPAITPAFINEIESARQKYHDEWISGGAVKFFLDGVVESHTAAMIAPYGDDPKQTGKLFWDPAKYKEAVAELDRRGIQLFTHAIGDGAVRLALDAYDAAEKTNATRASDPRHRVEHIETISAPDISRFGSQGVIASMQPLHAYPDEDTLGPWAKNAGPDRASRGFAWQSIAHAHGRLAFGSDWPVVTINPWPGVQMALTRQTDQGTPPGGWLPDQRLTLEQTIEAYTLGAAVAGRREKYEGSLEPGKLADLIVLSQDLFKVDPHKTGATEVLLTIVGGKVVYESPAWASQSHTTNAEKN
jgi:predicted amidohydrolase YtcJ